MSIAPQFNIPLTRDGRMTPEGYAMLTAMYDAIKALEARVTALET